MEKFIFKKAKILSLVFAFIVFLTSALLPTAAQSNATKKELSFAQLSHIEAKQLDYRAQILKEYLERYDSPLKNNAQDFIEAADANGLDWKLVPSIAGMESTFGKFTPGSDLYPSYNAWGWGVYGNQTIYFKSWKDGIYQLNSGLRNGYINKGLTNPYQINRVYAASPSWGSRVDYFMGDLERFTKTYEKLYLNPSLNNVLDFKQQLGKQKQPEIEVKLALI